MTRHCPCLDERNLNVLLGESLQARIKNVHTPNLPQVACHILRQLATGDIRVRSTSERGPGWSSNPPKSDVKRRYRKKKWLNNDTLGGFDEKEWNEAKCLPHYVEIKSTFAWLLERCKCKTFD